MKNSEKILRKVNLTQIKKDLVSHLLDQKWVSSNEIDEINAIVSHWLQSHFFQLPFLTKSILLECQWFISEYFNNNALDLIADRVCVPEEPYQLTLNFLFDNLPYPPRSVHKFTFIDLFAGIGGFRIAFQNAGGKCIFSCEWDKFAKKTYEVNFGEQPYGDIRDINKSDIPDHDVLCAGFPCQPFSLAGVSKKKSLGRKHGFEDETQGTLFFEIKEILRIKRPKAFILENVKNLLSHDKGRTFDVIYRSLTDQLGYIVKYDVIDGAKWLPQHRERVFIVGYDPKQIQISKSDINIPKQPSKTYSFPELNTIIEEKVENHTLGPGTWETLIRHKAMHAAKGNGFGYGIHGVPIKKGTVTRTISARYHKDGAEVLIEQKNERPRRLTIKEAMQLMGFDPNRFIFPVSNTQAYKQLGNSVIVPVVQDCAMEMAKILERASNDIT